MRITLHGPSSFDRRLSAALLAAGGAALVLAGFVLLVEDATQLESPAAHVDGPTLALCEEGALMVHDVLWAAACSALAERGLSDGHAECELPNAEAERLNRLLQQAERKCQAEAALAAVR